jgi:hypothetical protein
MTSTLAAIDQHYTSATAISGLLARLPRQLATRETLLVHELEHKTDLRRDAAKKEKMAALHLDRCRREAERTIEAQALEVIIDTAAVTVRRKRHPLA